MEDGAGKKKSQDDNDSSAAAFDDVARKAESKHAVRRKDNIVINPVIPAKKLDELASPKAPAEIIFLKSNAEEENVAKPEAGLKCDEPLEMEDYEEPIQFKQNDPSPKAQPLFISDDGDSFHGKEKRKVPAKSPSPESHKEVTVEPQAGPTPNPFAASMDNVESKIVAVTAAPESKADHEDEPPEPLAPRLEVKSPAAVAIAEPPTAAVEEKKLPPALIEVTPHSKSKEEEKAAPPPKNIETSDAKAEKEKEKEKEKEEKEKEKKKEEKEEKEEKAEKEEMEEKEKEVKEEKGQIPPVSEGKDSESDVREPPAEKGERKRSANDWEKAALAVMAASDKKFRRKAAETENAKEKEAPIPSPEPRANLPAEAKKEPDPPKEEELKSQQTGALNLRKADSFFRPIQLQKQSTRDADPGTVPAKQHPHIPETPLSLPIEKLPLAEISQDSAEAKKAEEPSQQENPFQATVLKAENSFPESSDSNGVKPSEKPDPARNDATPKLESESPLRKGDPASSPSHTPAADSSPARIVVLKKGTFAAEASPKLLLPSPTMRIAKAIPEFDSPSPERLRRSSLFIASKSSLACQNQKFATSRSKSKGSDKGEEAQKALVNLIKIQEEEGKDAAFARKSMDNSNRQSAGEQTRKVMQHLTGDNRAPQENVNVRLEAKSKTDGSASTFKTFKSRGGDFPEEKKSALNAIYLPQAIQEGDKQRAYVEDQLKLSNNRAGILDEIFKEDAIREAFATFDIDGDGYINAQELRAILNVLGEDEDDEVLDEMIRMFDSSGDGQVRWDEFYCKITGIVSCMKVITRE